MFSSLYPWFQGKDPEVGKPDALRAMRSRAEASQARWDRYFIDLCLLNASMSKDPSTKVGAVVVGPDREVRGTGFNGFPRGVHDRTDRLHDRDQKLRLVVHAEMNAILAAARVGIPLKDCTLYLAAMDAKDGSVWGGAPCIRCTSEMIQSGIGAVVSLPERLTPSRWHDSVREAREILTEAGIDFRDADWSRTTSFIKERTSA